MLLLISVLKGVWHMLTIDLGGAVFCDNANRGGVSPRNWRSTPERQLLARMSWIADAPRWIHRLVAHWEICPRQDLILTYSFAFGTSLIKGHFKCRSLPVLTKTCCKSSRDPKSVNQPEGQTVSKIGQSRPRRLFILLSQKQRNWRNHSEIDR